MKKPKNNPGRPGTAREASSGKRSKGHSPAPPAQHEERARKPASEPEPAAEGVGQAPPAGGRPAAPAPAEGLPGETSIGARNRAVRAQVEDFVANLPPGAESGFYSAMVSDRWSNGPAHADIPDGTYDVAGAEWLVTFRGGRIVSARHRSRVGDDESIETLVG